MSQTSKFCGRVTSLVYKADDFHIIKFATDKGQIYTAKGQFPFQDVKVGTWVSFEGKWIDHDQYGRQISVLLSPVDPGDWDDERVDSVLSSNGVGPQVRDEIRKLSRTSGVPMYNLMNSGDLSGTPLDEFTWKFAISRWNSVRVMFEVVDFLSVAGVPPNSVSKIWSTLGDSLQETITSDPWVLVKVAGISFKQSDEVAMRLGVSLSNPGRLRGAVISAVNDVYLEGHSFANTGQILGHLSNLMPTHSFDSRDIAVAIRGLRDDRQVAVRKAEDGSSAIYDPWVDSMEEFCSVSLVERISGAVTDISRETISEEIRKWSEGRGIHVTHHQTKAAVDAVVEPVSILTGLPGTGKTTTLQVVVSILQDLHTPYLLVAPTGIAAKRLSSVTGASASTVHRAFSASGFGSDSDRESTYVGVTGSSSAVLTDTSKEVWEYGPNNPHPARVVVIDECSMVDLHMLYRILQGTSKDCRLVFVGDPYQLPSVGAGDVLRSLVKSGRFVHTHLKDIFRQEGTSGIVTAAHDVHAGRTPDVTGGDFKLIPCSSESEASEIIKALSVKLFEREKNFQVLSPRHMGEAGVTGLNEVLRMAINPPSLGSSECRVMGSPIREGDRIMVIKNDYDKGVYNGDVGKVSHIDKRSQTLELRIFSGSPGGTDLVVRYPYNKGPIPIRLAYAQTIHKSQGQEYDHIVVPVLESFGRQLQRNLVYTAITRAKRKVFLVGEISALTKAVQNDVQESRNTLLQERIRLRG